MEFSRMRGFSDRLEHTYLGTLRIVVLVAATLLVLIAAFFLFNGTRKLATSTTVVEAPVEVTPAEVVAGVATTKDADGAGSSAEATLAKAEAQRFQAFKAGAFEAYYKRYAGLAQRYNKPEDPTLTRDELATALDYTIDAYRSGEDATVKMFIENAGYQKQVAAATQALVSDPRVAGQLTQYRAAQKTSQACTTEYQSRRMWDRNSMACSNWYEDPMGCSVIRQVPVEVCRPAYPAGITGPGEAFGQMDRGFRALWTARQTQVAAEATSKRTELEATKASGLPTLIQAVYAFGAFLAAMFLFLVVAIERHLRRLSTAPPV